MRRPKASPLEALFWVAISLGLRKGELAGLMVEDIDLEAAVLHVRRTRQRLKLPGVEKSVIIEGSPKSKQSRRDLPIPMFLVPVLRAHLDRREEIRRLATSRWKETGYLFASSVGTALEPRNIGHAFQRLCAKANLPRIRVHDLRHTCGTFLFAQGVPEFTIQQILGHSQLTTTRRYTHVNQALQKAALETVGNLLRKKEIGRSGPVAVKTAAKPRLARVK